MASCVSRLLVTVTCSTLLAVCLVSPINAQSAPLNSAVLIYDHKTLVAAPTVVERIAALGDRRLTFVVTMHCRLSPELKPLELGLMRDRYESWQAANNFRKLDEDLLRFYFQHLTQAFRRAAELEMGIAVLPHFDPAGDVLEWRNHFDFDPSEKLLGYSYETAVIDLCLNSLKEAVTQQTHIDFSLSGEMGRSCFAYPNEYRRLLAKIREELSGHEVTVGVSLNHNDVAGGHKPTPEQIKSLQLLLNDCDYLGFSNYRPFQLPPRKEQFKEDCEAFLQALADQGLQAPETTPLHFSEIGLGGAPDKQGKVSVAQAAAEPWEGIARGPSNPWASEAMTALRRNYHAALLTFLKTQPGPRRVEAAYFWSEGSWDPLGVNRPQFADPMIREQVRQHNAQAPMLTPRVVPAF